MHFTTLLFIALLLLLSTLALPTSSRGHKVGINNDTLSSGLRKRDDTHAVEPIIAKWEEKAAKAAKALIHANAVRAKYHKQLKDYGIDEEASSLKKRQLGKTKTYSSATRIVNVSKSLDAMKLKHLRKRYNVQPADVAEALKQNDEAQESADNAAQSVVKAQEKADQKIWLEEHPDPEPKPDANPILNLERPKHIERKPHSDPDSNLKDKIDHKHKLKFRPWPGKSDCNFWWCDI